jgi:hypothetical protein
MVVLVMSIFRPLRFLTPIRNPTDRRRAVLAFFGSPSGSSSMSSQKTSTLDPFLGIFMHQPLTDPE